MPNSKIVSTGCYIPKEVVPNEGFLTHSFYDSDGQRLAKPVSEIITTLQNITGIKERRYIGNELTTTAIATEAALVALEQVDHTFLSIANTFRPNPSQINNPFFTVPFVIE